MSRPGDPVEICTKSRRPTCQEVGLVGVQVASLDHFQRGIDEEDCIVISVEEPAEGVSKMFVGQKRSQRCPGVAWVPVQVTSMGLPLSVHAPCRDAFFDCNSLSFKQPHGP